MEEKIVTVLNEMSEYLSIAQMKRLQEVIIKTFAENEAVKKYISNEDFLKMFLDAKRIEGCSERTIKYYQTTIKHLLSQTTVEVRKLTTEDMREYLSNYQKRNNCSNVTIDNVRRNISSFFSWLEEEDYILKSPMKRIHKIKTKVVVKNIISDEGIEKLRDNCKEKRDLAIIDLLYSTGIRVGELVNLNIDDIDLEGRECIVYGKGDKERRVYFDAKTKVHLKSYIESRVDKNEALFVTLDATDGDNIYLSSTKEHIIQEGVKKSRLVKAGSLIFANCGVSLGFARIITFDGCIHDGWLAMEDIDERLDKVFLLQALNQMTEHFRVIAPAGTQPNMNTAIMKAYMQVIPPIELQREFIRFAEQVDKSKVVVYLED